MNNDKYVLMVEELIKLVDSHSSYEEIKQKAFSLKSLLLQKAINPAVEYLINSDSLTLDETISASNNKSLYALINRPIDGNDFLMPGMLIKINMVFQLNEDGFSEIVYDPVEFLDYNTSFVDSKKIIPNQLISLDNIPNHFHLKVVDPAETQVNRVFLRDVYQFMIKSDLMEFKTFPF